MIENSINNLYNDTDGDDNMALQTKIEKIITVSNQEFDEFTTYQQQRIKELKALKKQQSQGITIDVSPIVKNLQGSGFLDENGKIAAPYNRLFVNKE